MLLPVAVRVAAPSPGPTGRLDDPGESAGDLASWVSDHWQGWLGVGLQILLIVAIAATLRSVVRRMITRLIHRMNRTAEAMDETALGGLLVNAERRRQRTEAIGSVLRSVSSFVILGTGALMVLSALRIDLAPLLASAGVAGVALGFGARNLVTDFLSGVFMIIEDQYGVGDVIDAGVASGTVIEVGLRVTKLRGDHGEIWYIRNGEVKRIGNLSQGWSTAAVDVQLRYDEDLDEARTVIVAAGEEMSGAKPWDETLWGPVQVLGLDAVALDAVVLRVQAKTMPGRAADVERELRWRIKQALDAAGIRTASSGVGADESADDTGVAPPSVLANPDSPQAGTASPIAPPPQ